MPALPLERNVGLGKYSPKVRYLFTRVKLAAQPREGAFIN